MAVVLTQGFVQVERQLLVNVQSGIITASEYFLLMVLHTNADPSSGIWHASAGLIASLYLITERTCRDQFEKLEKKGFLRRFSVRGRHGQYPILVHGYKCTLGAMKGRKLNAMASTTWNDPIYDSCDEGVNEGVNDSAGKYLRKEKGETPVAHAPFELPAWIPREAWDGFVASRKSGRKKFTPRALDLLVNRLAQLRDAGNDPGDVLDQSTGRGWSGLFEVKSKITPPKTVFSMPRALPPSDPNAAASMEANRLAAGGGMR